MGRRISYEDISELVVLLPDVTYDRSHVAMETRTWRSRLRGVVGICMLLALTGIVYLGYFCPDHVCALSNRNVKEPANLDAIGFHLPAQILDIDKNNLHLVHHAFKLHAVHDVFLNDTSQFDINSHDVMVFLHVQKTGTTNISLC